jgi:group I intron endonuclease
VTERPGIYAIRNRRNGKIYVGSAANISKRWSRHRKDLREGCHRNRHRQAAFNRYGEGAFEFVVLEFTLDLTCREQYWIDITGCLNPDAGYNSAPRARNSKGRIGHRWTPEERAALSAAMRGRAGAGITAPVRYGGNNPRAKLTRFDVWEIRTRYGARKSFGRGKKHGGLTYEALAKEYAVSISVICEIIKGSAWRQEQCVITNLSLFPSAMDQHGKVKGHRSDA